MPWRMMLALLIVTAATGPASAQSGDANGRTTETQDRLAGDNSGDDTIWNLVGLLGLVGLIGLLPQHEEDSYHPSSFDD